MELDSSVTAGVTGGSSGLGEATARALAAKGVKIAIFDLNEENGEAVATDLGGVFCKVDVTSEADVDAGFEKARAAVGQERILINCAGTGNAVKTAGRDKNTGAIRHFPLAAFELIIQINLIGTFRCTAKSAAGMMTLDPVDEYGERGVIINTASVAAYDGHIGQVSYSASKGAITGMTLPIARDLVAVGVRVNTIAPSLVDTPIYGSGEGSEKFKAHLGQSVLFPKRLGEASELASMVVELITNDYMNAAVVRVDGGIRMPPK